MILVVESSLRDLHLGLYAEGETLATRRLEAGRGEQLDCLLSEALHEISASSADLDELLITRGPGSFTGLRTGLAFAMGLCFSGRIRLYTPPSTLAALSCLVPADEEVTVLLPAKPGLFYWGERVVDEDVGSVLSREELLSGDDLLRMNLESRFVVSDFGRKIPELESLLCRKQIDISDGLDLSTFLRLLSRLEFADPKTGIRPNYLAEASATVRARK